MADVAASNVTILSTWNEGGVSGKRHVVARAKWTGVTAGGVTNRVLASAFGFRQIFDCSDVLLDASTKKVYPAEPSADGTMILLSNPNQATDANRADVADLAVGSDSAYITLRGFK